ncbi:MAG: GSU2403 family nucleotidyltransferase fold protein [Elusimicrobiota bacterium]
MKESLLIEQRKIESAFFNVLNDLREYLYNLTLVGGWVPYIYSTYLWKKKPIKIITTVDIDFGFGDFKGKKYQKTIFEKLSSLDYSEHHIEIGKIYPVVLFKEGKIPVEFITYPDIGRNTIENLIGIQININKVDGFDFLLNHRCKIKISTGGRKAEYEIHCPIPSAFLYHKGATFLDREDELKQAKDLHYMYFILRYAPDADSILKEIKQYSNKGYFEDISEKLYKYFGRKSGKGCLLVEKEHGSDEFIEDLRKDIFERFSKLIDIIR